MLESMQHGQDIEAQLDEVMQDADDADVAVQFAEADNPEQHAGMCQPACSEAFGQAAIGHEHQLGQDVPDSQQQTGGAGTSGRLNAANLQPPLRDLHLTGHVHDELAAAQPQVPPYSFDEARQLMLSHHAQRTLKSLAALPAEETEKPWQLPGHSFRHDVMACSPAPVAFDMRHYMPELTPVTGAEAALEWRNERIRYWRSLRTPKTVARHEKMAEAVEQAASRGPRKQSAGHRMVALARDKMKFNLLHQRQRLRRGSPLRLPQLWGWMLFGLMRHRGLKRAQCSPPQPQLSPSQRRRLRHRTSAPPSPFSVAGVIMRLCIQALCVPSSCAFDDAFWVLSRPQLSWPSIAGGAPAFQFEFEVYILDRTRGRKIPGKLVQSVRNKALCPTVMPTCKHSCRAAPRWNPATQTQANTACKQAQAPSPQPPCLAASTPTQAPAPPERLLQAAALRPYGMQPMAAPQQYNTQAMAQQQYGARVVATQQYGAQAVASQHCNI